MDTYRFIILSIIGTVLLLTGINFYYSDNLSSNISSKGDFEKYIRLKKQAPSETLIKPINVRTC